MFNNIILYLYSLYNIYILPVFCTYFDEIICVCLSGSSNSLDLQFSLVGSTPGGAQTGTLRFTTEMFVYDCY